MKYLFTPVKIGSLEVRNRIVMPAIHTGFSPDGHINDRIVNYFETRAGGGAGLIIVGGCAIDEVGKAPMMIHVSRDKFIPGLQRLAGAIKKHGCRAAVQLYQSGRYAYSWFNKLPSMAPSAVPSRLTGETPREMTTDDIREVAGCFAAAALRAKKAGFDAVEVIASAGYLICQFLSPITNKRSDLYGGSLENRMRFGLEVIREVKAAVGKDYPVLVRVSGNEFMPGGSTNEEIRLFCVELEKAGADAINVTGGWHETMVPQITMDVPPGAYVYLAQGIKQAVGVPVVACNRINDPVLAEKIIFEGRADLVGIGRGLIADPEFPAKARAGRLDEIRKCVGCNQGCMDRVFSMSSLGCLVNPQAGKEAEKEIKPAAAKKKVLVIGGGPGGMEAAGIAAARGHRVFLWEKKSELGGQLRLAAVPPGRKDFRHLVSYLKRQMESVGVEISLNKEADVQSVRALKPDAVIIATGAGPIRLNLAGNGKVKVVSAWDVLEGKETAGGKVVVVGGGAVGCETALHLAQIGTIDGDTLKFLARNRAESVEDLIALVNRGMKKVTVLEMTGKVGRDIGLSSRWIVLKELKASKVETVTGAKVTEVTAAGVLVETAGGVKEFEADTVVVAVGSRPVNDLYAELQGISPEIYVIGDAQKPRKALEAVAEGFETGNSI
ncbi:MAG: FAD-dependent oxidoreductase [Firmicutes bacterium]|nr:FAD-dependent oxidoreductase [Bacillota bacterium]